MNNITTIQITKQKVQKLKQILKKSETYEEGISRLLKEWQKKN